MKFLLNIPLSSDRLWEFTFILIGGYLLFHPALAHPQSYAVVLGGGLLLLFFKTVSGEFFGIMGRTWGLFLLFLALSAFWSVSPGVTLQSAGIVFLGTLLYAMAKSNSLEAQSRIEVVGLAMALVASLMAVYQWFFGFGNLASLLPGLSGEEHGILKAAIYNKRASGPFVTHGALAAFLILFIPQGFILWKTRSGFKKGFFGVSTLVLVAGLLATQSVGACFCLTLAVLMVLLRRRSKASMGVALAVGVVGMVSLIAARGVQSWFLAAFGTRLILWKAALVLFGKHPWLGTGLGTFGEAYQRAGLPMETGSRFTHNVFLQVLVETGLTGFLVFSAALLDLARRLKIPSRWEGWGVGTGVLAFLLFSLLDLPFQMPEIIWIFAVVAARLELSPGKSFELPSIPEKWVELGLLGVLLISGFWPPFRPWNFALLAVVLWTAMAYFQAKIESVPLWVFAGGLFLALRAFYSPSSSGAVRFLETTGLVLVFVLIQRSSLDPNKFLLKFCWLGIFWALRVWWFSFQYSDIKYWKIFPNPKQVGLFLLPLLFLPFSSSLDLKDIKMTVFRKVENIKNASLSLFALATFLRLNAFSSMVGGVVGFVPLVKKTQRYWIMWIACFFVALILLFRVTVFHSLEKSSTQWDRFYIWESAVKVLLRHPVMGAGPGAFSGLYHQVKSPRASGVSRYLMDAQYAHNEFLEFLTAFGLIGFLWGAFFLASLRPWAKGPGKTSALAALGTASLVDFCLHTPLIVFQGTGLLMDSKKRKFSVSPVAGFLALGTALGLFGSAAFVPLLQQKARDSILSKQFQLALRCLEGAEQLNAWDASVAAEKAHYLEKLYLATKDPVWGRKSDGAFERVVDLEKADGQWRFENAERLTQRLRVDASPEAFQKAQEAWYHTRVLLPFSGLERYEEGLFFIEKGDKEQALIAFEAAEEMEPNYAAPWVNVGLLLREKGEKALARKAFQRALDVYNQWKDADRIDSLEKQMVSLPTATVEFLKKETAR